MSSERDDESSSTTTTTTAAAAAPDFSHLLPRTQLLSTATRWLNDDAPSFDVGGLVVGTERRTASLYMKSPGVLAGKPFFEAAFDAVGDGCAVTWETAAEEGRTVEASSSSKVLLATVSGPANSLLRAERTALNALSRCSGVATAASRAVKAARDAGWKGHVAGTRKTTPGFRIAEKYGLLVGGAATHRLDLSQMIMLKDNHIWTAKSITNAVKLARKAAGFSQKIEVECQSLQEALEASEAGADIVMLDNFSPPRLKLDAAKIKSEYPHVVVEASGGITADTMVSYLSEHVDVVSRGNLTQGYDAVDFSLKINH